MPAERGQGGVHLTGCSIVHVSKAAFLVELDGDQFWIPKSVIDEPQRSALEDGDDGVTLTIPEWLAKDKNIEVG